MEINGRAIEELLRTIQGSNWDILIGQDKYLKRYKNLLKIYNPKTKKIYEKGYIII
jgi:hypothetical protein